MLVDDTWNCVVDPDMGITSAAWARWEQHLICSGSCARKGIDVHVKVLLHYILPLFVIYRDTSWSSCCHTVHKSAAFQKLH